MSNGRKIVEALGGRARVAEITGVKANAVRAWDRIGVPYRFWALLNDHARENGLDEVTLEAMVATKPDQKAA